MKKILELDTDTSADNGYIKKITITVAEHQKKLRLDKYLSLKLEKLSRAQIQKLITTDHVRVNNKSVKSSQSVNPLDSIELSLPEPEPSEITAEDIPLDIVYEDDYLLVVNKAAGMVVHPAYGNMSGTLVNALIYHCNRLSDVSGVKRPGIVHRLDKDTSGLLVVAKDDYTHQQLSLQFAERTTEREYRAIIWGQLKKKSGRLESHLTRSKRDRTKMVTSAVKGKFAVTNYIEIKKYNLTSLISLKLETGRTHQIRVHLNSIGHPVFGDEIYGGRQKRIISLNQKDQQLAIKMLNMMPRQALHAKSLGLLHPITKQFLRFDSELPQDMQELINFLEHVE